MEERYGAPVAGTEKAVLSGFLDHYRKTMVAICEGLDDGDLRRPIVASGTTLLGMVKHLAYVERGWFQETIVGEKVDYPFDFDNDPDADFRVEPSETTEEIIELYQAECAKSRRILDEVSLDDLAKGKHRSRDYNVRWIVVHMIEETARHAGHADILREQIDGKVGTGY
jgi:uncharacterized damage-inducible protein DinB